MAWTPGVSGGLSWIIPMMWLKKYVGLPFVNGGRDFNGVDCWGLVRLVLKEECRVEVPSYGDISAGELAKVANMVGTESMREPWIPVAGKARCFDVAVMHRRKSPIHVGIIAERGLLLHIEEATSAVIVPLNHPSVSFRSISIFRHEALLNAA
jgi:cell wall-associated NlpC family hydrolase